MDIVARTVPVSLRGRFFAVSSLVGGAGGLLGSVLTAWVLARMPAADAYAVCFLLSALFMGLSYVALARVREPRAAGVDAAPPLGTYLLRVGRVLREDRNLTWFLVARGVIFVGMMASGFYTVYALRHYAAPDWAVGVFTAGLLAGQMAGNGVGALADRADISPSPRLRRARSPTSGHWPRRPSSSSSSCSCCRESIWPRSTSPD
jgi:hypothetical protein